MKSGEDKLFQPKPKKHGVHLVTDGKEQVKPTHIGKDVKVHEINFSFVASHTSLSRAKAKCGPAHQCSQCGHGVKLDDRFCAGCGGSLAVRRMTDQEKRRAAAVEVTSSDSEGFTKVDADEPKVAESINQSINQSINESINQTCMPVGSPFGRRRSAKTRLICTIIYKRLQIFNVCKIE